MGLISNGTTIFDNGAMASGFGGSMNLISSTTASSSASIEFTLGDFKEYKFIFVNIHGSAESQLTFNISVDSGSNYNVAKTTTFFLAEHAENDSFNSLAYQTGRDLAQDTGFKVLQRASDFSDADQSASGSLQLFNPSSTTFVKHFISRIQSYGVARTHDSFAAGYANTTSALTNIKFQMSTGNIDDGKILMFGLN